ncbi:MAG: CynX/NimT family MFS transporter, partial [Granulosicoccus sp.]
MTQPIKSRWPAIFALFLCGCTVALHIGKIPPALPEIRQYWRLSLTEAGVIVSLYAVLIALTGVAAGWYVKRAGYARFAIIGVGLIGLASILGAKSTHFEGLLISRVAEGFGWVLTAIAMPTLLSQLSNERDRPLVMGIWGAFVPLGAGLALLLSPGLQSAASWRLPWHTYGVISLLAAAIILLITRHCRVGAKPHIAAETTFPMADLLQSRLWTISVSFFIYSFLFSAVTSFLPTLAIETSNLSLQSSSYLVAMVVMSNVLGNVSAGIALRSGYRAADLLLTGALCMGISSWLLFNEMLPLWLRVVSAFVFAIAGGLVPGTCFAVLPRLSVNQSNIGLMTGFMLQWIGLGQLIGPFAAAAAVDY